MKYKEHITASGHKIQIWDGIYDYATQVSILRGITESTYKFSSTYDNEVEAQEGTWSVYSDLNVNMSEAFFTGRSTELQKELNGMTPFRMWINASTKETDHSFHPDSVDPGCKSLLYYANIKWDRNWDGYTIWRTPNLEDIEFVSDYVPGRIIIFDSIIPHKASVASKRASPFRFTVNTIWKPSDGKL